MAATLTIKNVPDAVLDQLRERAKRNHRSLQGEVRAILEAAASSRPLTVAEARARIEQLGLRTSSESVAMIREDRDAR